MRKPLVGLMAAALVWTTVFAAPSPSSASNFHQQTGADYGCNGYTPPGAVALNMADNSAHTFYFQGLTPQYISNAVNWSRTNNYDPTNIDTSLDGSLDEHTDVVVKNADYTFECGVEWWPFDVTVGLVTCDYLLAGSGGKCDRHTVFLHRSVMANQGESGRRKIACHEIGHTLALKHWETDDLVSSCMEDDAMPPPSGFLNAHDNTHLNDATYYP